MKKPLTNKAHSVAARLSKIAVNTKTTYEYILLRYGQERLLWRMAKYKEFDTFVLKGASLFLVWQGQFYRTTRDIDFLGSGSPDMERIGRLFTDLCVKNYQDVDGLVFDKISVRTSTIQDNQDYSGIRVNIRARLDRARIDLQVDIGFGDAITPAAERIEFPSLLGETGTIVMVYPRYTAMAEKFLAMTRLGIDNSRMKDFYDMVVMFRLFDFDEVLLAKAIKSTCMARKYQLTNDIPVGLSATFYEDSAKNSLLSGFSKRAGLTIDVGSLQEVVLELRKKIVPVLAIIHKDQQ